MESLHDAFSGWEQVRVPRVIGRRGAVAGLVSLSAGAGERACAAALSVPAGNRIGFQMRRKGDLIGTHVLNFAVQGDGLVVSVAIDIVVRLLGIAVYRYSHRATETWVGGRLMAFASRTDRDGKDLWLRMQRGAEGLVVEGSSSGRYVAPDGVLPTTYWNKASLTGRLIDSEDGDLMNAPVSEVGMDAAPLASGGTLMARHYRLAGDLPLDLWYDQAGQWVGLVFSKGGVPVIYEKL